MVIERTRADRLFEALNLGERIWTEIEFRIEIDNLSWGENTLTAEARVYRNNELRAHDRFHFINPPLRTGDGTYSLYREYETDPVLIESRLVWYTDEEYNNLTLFRRNRLTATGRTDNRENMVLAPRLTGMRILLDTARIVTKNWTDYHLKWNEATQQFIGDTYTCYSTTADGYASSRNSNWNTARNGSNLSSGTTTTDHLLAANWSIGNYWLDEAFLDFDTATIPDNYNVDSYTMSLYGTGTQDDANSLDVQARVYAWSSVAWFDVNPNTNWTDLALFAHKSIASWTINAYNDFTSDSQQANVNKTGYTKIIVALSCFATGTAPTASNDIGIYYADYTGTTRDPKLVVVATSAAQTATPDPLVQTETIPSVTVLHSRTVTPNALTLTQTIPDVSVAHLRTVTPNSLVQTETIPNVSTASTLNITPLVLTQTILDVSISMAAHPDSLIMNQVMPDVTATIGITIAPDSLILSQVIPDVSLVIELTVEPNALVMLQIMPEVTAGALPITVLPQPLVLTQLILEVEVAHGEVIFTIDSLVQTQVIPNISIDIGVIPDSLILLQIMPEISLSWSQIATPDALVLTQIILTPSLILVPVIDVPPTPQATAAQVANALAGYPGGNTAIQFRYYRKTRKGGFLDEIVAVQGPVKISVNNERAAIWDMDIVLNRQLLPSDFNVTSDILAVEAEVYVPAIQDFVTIPCGLYVLDSSSESRYSSHTLLPCKGSDLCMLLMRARGVYSDVILDGQLYTDVVKNILDFHGLVYEVPDSTLVIQKPIPFPPGTSDYTKINTLLFAINYYPLTADANGKLWTRYKAKPSTELPSIVYSDAVEPMMISGKHAFTTRQNPKTPNRVRVIADSDVEFSGYVEKENIDTAAINSTRSLAYGTAFPITSSGTGTPRFPVTFASHLFTHNQTVLFYDHEGADLTLGLITGQELKGTFAIDVVDGEVFVPATNSAVGSGGFAQATIAQTLEFKGDPTKALYDFENIGDAICDWELEWATLKSEQVEFYTLLDPRRGAREFYEVTYEGETHIYACLGWEMTLAPGQYMKHTMGRVREIDIIGMMKTYNG